MKTYDELLEIVQQLQKDGKEKDKRIEKLEKQAEHRTKELQKYHNENTPSGAIPSHLKDLEKNVKEMTTDTDKEDQPPKHNARNSRPRYIDRRQYDEPEDTECGHYGGRLIKKKATR